MNWLGWITFIITGFIVVIGMRYLPKIRWFEKIGKV